MTYKESCMDEPVDGKNREGGEREFKRQWRLAGNNASKKHRRILIMIIIPEHYFHP